KPILDGDSSSASDGRPDLRKVIAALGELEMTSLLIEGGALVNWAALTAGIVDKICFYYAPRILGGADAIPFATGAGFRSMGEAAQTSRGLRRGDSVAVSGVCLTAIEVRRGKSFSADLAAETRACTSLGRLHPGALVNLELPIRAGTPLGGHIVQGHVDGVGKLVSLAPANPLDGKRRPHHNHDWWLRIRLPRGQSKYVVEKGSITIEGISLTVAKLSGDDA